MPFVITILLVNQLKRVFAVFDNSPKDKPFVTPEVIDYGG